MQGSFFTIAENGTADDVYFLYGQGADIHEIHKYGKLPIGVAAAAGNTAVVRALVELGADPDEDDYEGYTPVQYAIWGRHYETVFALLEFGNNAARQRREIFALLEAASAGDDTLLNALLDRGVDINARDKDGSTALMYAARERNLGSTRQQLTVMRTLIRRGADVHLKENKGETALQIAAWPSEDAEERRRASEAVHLLLQAGAHWNIADAVALDDMEATRRCLIIGADVNTRDWSGDTLLQIAALYNYIDIVGLLIEYGADVAAVNERGDDALSYGVDGNYPQLVCQLLRGGANPNRKNNSGGETPLMEAAHQDAADIIQMLLDAGAEVNATNKFDYTALMIAAEENALKAAHLLLKAGADVHRENIHLGTALGYAVNLGHDELAALLRAHGARLITE